MIKNLVGLYSVHISNFLLPLVTIPYLARILGPARLGEIAIAQAVGMYVSIMIDYGFSLSATRDAARERDDRQRLAELVSGVLGAKLLLGAATVAIAIAVLSIAPGIQVRPSLLWMGITWGAAQGMSMIWFQQAIEQVGTIAKFEVTAKVLATCAIFLFVRRPEDIVLIMGIEASAAGACMIRSLQLTFRHVGYFRPTLKHTKSALRSGFAMFLFRSSLSLYTTANVFILGLFAPVSVVGFFAGAQKVSRTPLGLFTPFTQAIVPRLSYLVHAPVAEQRRFRMLSAAVLCGSGLAMSIALFFAAPLIVRLVLGPGYEPAVPALRILSLLIPVVSANIFLGQHCLLPLGEDAAFVKVTLAAGLLNLAGGALLAYHFQHIGMAWAAVAAEVFVLLGLCEALRRHGRRREDSSRSAAVDLSSAQLEPTK